MATIKYNAKVWVDTAANFASDTTIYDSNDFLFTSDTGVLKKGDGVSAYAALGAIGVAAWADITGKPATFAPEIGTTATKAAAGNHVHAVTADETSGLEAAANIQALAVALSTRIKALETAP